MSGSPPKASSSGLAFRGAWARGLGLHLTIAPLAQGAPCALPWERVGETASHVADDGGPALLVVAALAPAIAAPTGFDHELRRLAQGTLGGRYDLEPVTPLLPWSTPGAALVLHLGAHAFDACTLQRTTAAVLQGTTITAIAVVALKATTGRTWPNGGGDPRAEDRLDHPEWSRSFDWLSGRIVSAWPSGHTAIMMATAASVDATGASPALAWTLYGASALVGAGMVLGDHHYASDVASGAILGLVVGRAAGRAFAGPPGTTAWVVSPLLGPGLAGASLAVAF